VTAALESAGPDEMGEDVCNLVDKVGAVVVLALENADIARKSRGEALEITDGGKSVVKAGR
jgi:hypothetical protein